jgi:hypothetical protein
MSEEGTSPASKGIVRRQEATQKLDIPKSRPFDEQQKVSLSLE